MKTKSNKVIDYSKMSDKDLLALYNKLEEEKKGIPKDIPRVLHERNLLESYTGTYHS